MIAVIATGGKQYVVQPGDTLVVEKLEADSGETVSFDTVLLTANEDGSSLALGTPTVPVVVKAEVVEGFRTQKIRVIKYKRKVRYRKVHGHRQSLTKIKIVSIA